MIYQQALNASKRLPILENDIVLQGNDYLQHLSRDVFLMKIKSF